MEDHIIEIVQVAGLVLIALIQAYTARQNARTREDVKATRADMKTLEKQTNSIKDALVASTAKASRAQGRREGRESLTASKDKAKR